ncbi:MAG: PfkB family carbohydrate kinase [Actinomycetota bacterium]|nr:PfkB family carbohydrate kinase [Actinomycetota bacterium]
MTEPGVVCLGDVMVDVVAHLRGPIEPGSDRPAKIELRGGGSAANTAAWLAFAGIRTALIARVGDDPLGIWSRALLGAGVHAPLSTDLSLPTGTCIVLVGPDGERTMVPDPGANASLCPSDVDAALLTAPGHLHVSGYALFGEAAQAALHAMALARSSQMTVSVGAASAAPLRALGAAKFFELVGDDVLLVANQDEARVLTNRDDPAQAVRALSARVGRAIVTCGVHSALWSSAGQAPLQSPAEPVVVRDTTGAGDAFIAGVLGALLAGGDPRVALATGHKLGAQACLVTGGRPPTADHP